MVDYKSIYKFYEKCFKEHGDTPQGLAWPNEEGMQKRFRVMEGLVDAPHASLLDLGCGTGRFLEYLKKNDSKIDYTGMDISKKFIDHCKKTYITGDFHVRDILREPLDPDSYNYIVMNGILTVKNSLSFPEMWDFTKSLVKGAFLGATHGIAFNVMSKQVDWERDDLFHLSLDELANFLSSELSRNFVIRNDYGMYEYTVYMYKSSR
jgi:SAM-dependent methyltransferase